MSLKLSFLIKKEYSELNIQTVLYSYNKNKKRNKLDFIDIILLLG
jgi:hypothetical protein